MCAFNLAVNVADITSPAVDNLLRGFGGRENKVPERSCEHTYSKHDSDRDDTTMDKKPVSMTMSFYLLFMK